MVGVELRGNLSFPIDITIGFNFATAMCKSKEINHITLHRRVDMYVFITAAIQDFFGVPFNLRFTETSIQSVNISIVEDDLVEGPEEIQLVLTTLTPGMILIDPNFAVIEIMDNDGQIVSLSILYICTFVINISTNRCCISVLHDIL